MQPSRLACVAAISFSFPNARERDENCERVRKIRSRGRGCHSHPPYFSQFFAHPRRASLFLAWSISKGKETTATPSTFQAGCFLSLQILYIKTLPGPNNKIRIGFYVLHGEDWRVNEAPRCITQIVPPFARSIGLLGIRSLWVADLVWERGELVSLIIVKICHLPEASCKCKQGVN